MNYENMDNYLIGKIISRSWKGCWSKKFTNMIGIDNLDGNVQYGNGRIYYTHISISDIEKVEKICKSLKIHARQYNTSVENFFTQRVVICLIIFNLSVHKSEKGIYITHQPYIQELLNTDDNYANELNQKEACEQEKTIPARIPMHLVTLFNKIIEKYKFQKEEGSDFIELILHSVVNRLYNIICDNKFKINKSYNTRLYNKIDSNIKEKNGNIFNENYCETAFIPNDNSIYSICNNIVDELKNNDESIKSVYDLSHNLDTSLYNIKNNIGDIVVSKIKNDISNIVITKIIKESILSVLEKYSK